MAVVTRPCGDFRWIRNSACRKGTSRNGWNVRSACDFVKTQICTVALSLTLFNCARLPKEAFKYGAVPYLVVYTFWLLAVGLPTTLLELAMGQLSQQDPVGVWRAVPILRGVGHLKVLTSYICCVYYMMYVALALAFLVWIGKGTFPLRDCTRLQMTPNGYENKMNASECFKSTFLSPFTDYPQYLGIMAILIFILWFFLPILLYRLRKTLKVAMTVLVPSVVLFAALLATFLAKSDVLNAMFESCEQWTPLSEPYIWHSALVQALLSTHISGGYLISSGGTIYRHSDVRWTSACVIMTSIFSGWLWVLLWESIGAESKKNTDFVSILVLVYQSSISERRSKQWPLLAYGVIFLSGIITMVTLLFPVFDKLHRLTGDHWRLFASASSAVGTAFTVAVLARGLEVATMLDDLVIPLLTTFTTAVEVVGFVFIYGWCYLTIDIEFLTGMKLPCFWIATWWCTPILVLGTTGWWLRALLRATWGQEETLWPLVGAFAGILIVMIVIAAVAVAKEEQFNLTSKISSAFKSSRLWGPEEPMARYVWMSQRYLNDTLSSTNEVSYERPDSDAAHNKYKENWLSHKDKYQKEYDYYSRIVATKTPSKASKETYPAHTIPRSETKVPEEKFRSPNICIAEAQIGGPTNCNCNRHFKLNVPKDLRNNEVTTSL